MCLPFERHASSSAEREDVLNGVGEDGSNGAKWRSFRVQDGVEAPHVQRCHVIRCLRLGFLLSPASVTIRPSTAAAWL